MDKIAEAAVLCVLGNIANERSQLGEKLGNVSTEDIMNLVRSGQAQVGKPGAIPAAGALGAPKPNPAGGLSLVQRLQLAKGSRGDSPASLATPPPPAAGTPWAFPPGTKPPMAAPPPNPMQRLTTPPPPAAGTPWAFQPGTKPPVAPQPKPQAPSGGLDGAAVAASSGGGSRGDGAKKPEKKEPSEDEKKAAVRSVAKLALLGYSRA